MHTRRCGRTCSRGSKYHVVQDLAVFHELSRQNRIRLQKFTDHRVFGSDFGSEAEDILGKALCLEMVLTDCGRGYMSVE